MLFALPHVAAAQSVLGEADVIRMARSRAPASVVAGATESLADARTRTAGRFSNPWSSWAREAVEAGAEDVVSVTVPVDIARPLATRSLVASQGAWMRAEAAMTRTDAVLDALLAYYDAVVAERRVEVLATALANLDEAARVLARREAAGSASGYESTRLAIAGELGRSHLAEARGELYSAKARLAVLLDVGPESVKVATALALMPESVATALAERGGASRDAIRHARASQRLAAQAADRAGWAWLPTIELGGGIKHVSDPGGYGYVAGVSVSIPIFDRGQTLRAEAEAWTALSAARSQALARTIDAEVQGALATFRMARQELDRFESLTSAQVDTLLTAAQSGYREGQRSIVELLDAQRAQTEVAERHLALLRTAKHAEARLRNAAGDLQ